MMERPKVSFITLGCKVNQYETQAIRERFLQGDYKETEGKADIYLINSCTVTAEADRECRLLIRSCHRANPHAKIIVTGCYAQRDDQEIWKMEGVTHVIKNHDKARIRDILGGREVQRPSAPAFYVPLSISDFKDHTRAFIKVQDGCDYRCAFCKVWTVRGRSVSRAPQEILEEARRLAEKGFKEVVLTGVSIGLYGKDLSQRVDLLDLVFMLEVIPQIERIRLSSIDPLDVTEILIEKLLRSEKCCRQLHLSLQSGSDEILRRMNRNYTTSQYCAIVERLREKVPDFSITTDVIVGFPGEEESHFQESLDFIRDITPTRIHAFPYSARKGTLAHRFQGAVDPSVIRERARRLKAAALECSLRYRKPLLGQIVTVLFERPEEEVILSGYTDRYVKVDCPAPLERWGKVVPVRIERLEGEKTFGKLV